jgi:CTP:molybdopterin cytidylyltransferase MocA
VPSVSAVLLAAGQSARMGRQKALLPWHGAPLLEYQLTQLAAVEGVRQVVVVTGHEPERIATLAARFPLATVAHNPAWATGKVSSILAGLRAVPPGSDAIVLLAVDQPRPAAVVAALVRAHLERRPPATVPVRAGRRGHPVVFDAALLPELLQISQDTLGVRAVLQRHADGTLELEMDDPVIHTDLNAPADVASATDTG